MPFKSHIYFLSIPGSTLLVAYAEIRQIWLYMYAYSPCKHNTRRAIPLCRPGLYTNSQETSTRRVSLLDWWVWRYTSFILKELIWVNSGQIALRAHHYLKIVDEDRTEYVSPDSGGSSIAVPESLSLVFLNFWILFRIEMRILYRYFNKVGSAGVVLGSCKMDVASLGSFFGWIGWISFLFLVLLYNICRKFTWEFIVQMKIHCCPAAASKFIVAQPEVEIVSLLVLETVGVKSSLS